MAQLCAGVAHELMLLYYIATASCLRVRKRDRVPGGQTSRRRRQLLVVEGWARVRLDTPAWAISSWWRPLSRLRVKSSDKPQILFSVPLPPTGWAAMSSGSRAIDSAMLQAGSRPASSAEIGFMMLSEVFLDLDRALDAAVHGGSRDGA